ncbi:hypothetical protein [Natrinema sp. 74]|uniref:hypothetical protein n=1 Tax=Natrinema sp. 74 TaxID=3384159 RepID=UPI0038D44C45
MADHDPDYLEESDDGAWKRVDAETWEDWRTVTCPECGADMELRALAEREFVADCGGCGTRFVE